MSSLELSQATQVYINNIEKQKTPQKPAESENKKHIDNSTKITLALTGLAIISSAVAVGLGISKGKLNLQEAQGFFDKCTLSFNGNNKMLNETAQVATERANDLIERHPETYQGILSYIQSVITPKTMQEIAPDGYAYHGTSLDSAKLILENGITPFASKETGNKVPGLGRGVYTTPTLELAQHYSNNGIILPYKVEGDVAQVDIDLIEFRSNIASYILNAICEDRNVTSLFDMELSKEAAEYTPEIINKALRELGYSGLYTPMGYTKGFLNFGSWPEGVEQMGQLAIYDGEKLTLDLDRMKELNPITKDNYRKFLNALGK